MPRVACSFSFGLGNRAPSRALGQTRLVRSGRPAVPLRTLGSGPLAACSTSTAAATDQRVIAIDPAAVPCGRLVPPSFSRPPAMPPLLRIAVTLSLVGAALWSPLRADEADDQYAVAAGHYAQGRWQLACDEFQTLIREHPTDPRMAQALFFSGEALVQLGRHEDCARSVRPVARSLAAQPRGPAGPVSPGRGRLRAGTDRASPDTTRSVSFQPSRRPVRRIRPALLG